MMMHLSHFKQFLPLVLGKATSFQLDNMESVKKGLGKKAVWLYFWIAVFLLFPRYFPAQFHNLSCCTHYLCIAYFHISPA